MTAKNILQNDEQTDAPHQYQTSPPHRILVVDDEPDIRQLNAEVLIHSGYEVDVAEDGVVAWNALRLNNYDLLVTDHNMPKVTGVELLKKLRAARMILPVILVLGTIPTKELSRHPWLQIDATLLKPYTADELLATVRKVLYATEGGHDHIAPRPNWQDRPPTDRLQL